MSQFNAQKNPPWARANEFQQSAGMQQQMMNPNVMQYPQQAVPNPQQAQQVYQAQIAMQQQALSMQFVNNAQSMYNPAVSGLPQANVSRPIGMMNQGPVMMPQASLMQQHSSPQQPQPQQRDSNSGGGGGAPNKQRVFTGTVTKVVDSYGFVDEDVFFQMSCVKGPHPVLHDRVLVEAVCLPAMPFKWNATRVQVLPMNEGGGGGGGGGGGRKRPLSPRREERNSYSAVPPPNEFEHRRERERNRDRERVEVSGRDLSRGKSPDLEERRRRRERRERDEKEKEREKESRAKSRSRSRSPRRARLSPVKKYRFRIPEVSLDVSQFTVSLVKSRYSSMYIPSDFFVAHARWSDAPQQRPLQLAGSVRFHVVDKDIDPVFPREDLVEPPDADFTYSAKVMMLSIPSQEELIRRCVQLAEEKDPARRARTHAARLVDCLVGVNTRNKSEYMAIGGPWSPSLDGEDPVGDPRVLVKTAIRCCRALTGVDLSSVTKWYRFSEIHYHRNKTTYKGKEVPARVETVVIYAPDVWSAMPSALEWDGVHLNYQRALEKRLAELGVEPSDAAPPDDDKETEPATVQVKEPTHWSKIDLKTIKVIELREELLARKQSPKGLRLQLIARLTKLLKQEQDVEEEAAKLGEPEEKKRKEKPKEEDKKSKERDEKEKEVRDKMKERENLIEKFKLPETPHVVVHPCKKAKSGKFNCKVVCLSLLLDYNQDVNKEHSFEVSLFAENLNEMLMRDFGLQIYEALFQLPEKEEKEKKEETKDEKDAKGGKEKPKEEIKEKCDDKKEKSKDEDKVSQDEAKKSEENTKGDKVDRVDDKKSPSDEDKNGKKSEDNGAKKNDDNKEAGERNGDKEKPAVNGKDDDEDDRRRRRRAGEKDRKKKEKVAYQTVNPTLLLAFSYFDTTLYGKITSSDLEELMQTLGLNLSRSQIKKLVGKIPSSDTYLDYRKLTDAPIKTEVAEGAEKEKTEVEPAMAETIQAAEGVLRVLHVELGNKPLLPNFSLTPPPPPEGKKTQTPPAKRTRRSGPAEIKPEPMPVAEGYVMYNGCLLNVENLQELLRKNEEARLQSEEKSLSLKHDLSDVRAKFDVVSKQLSDAKVELEGFQRKLSGVNERLEHELISSDLYLTTLMDIQERIMPILDTDELKRLARLRQQLLGSPQINLVPLTKLEDIAIEEVEMEDVKSAPEEVPIVKTESEDTTKEEC